jgi:ribosome-binding factor A
MSSVRQQKIEAAIQGELGVLFQRLSAEICLGAMVSVTVVRITADLSLAKCYLSVYAHVSPAEVLKSIQTNQGKIRGQIGQRLKNLRKIPSLTFYIDDSLEYASRIEELLKPKN